MRYIRTFNENVEKSKSVISKKMAAYEKLKTLLSANIGYLGKFTEFLFSSNVSYNDLRSLYNDIIYLKHNNINIDINKYEGIEQLIDHIIKNKNKLIVNRLINRFPAEQKKIAKEMLSRSIDFNLFLNLANLEDITFFITKISRYKNSGSLRDAIKLAISNKKSLNADDVKSIISDSKKSKIVYDKDNYMIVLVDNIEDLRKLASDTSWCILSQNMWKSYTHGRFQFILFDFNLPAFDVHSKIGFTMNPDGTIRAAHSVLDEGCIPYINEMLDKLGVIIFDLLDVKLDIDSLDFRNMSNVMLFARQLTKDTDVKKLVSKICSLNSFINNPYTTFKDVLRLLIKKYFIHEQFIRWDMLLDLFEVGFKKPSTKLQPVFKDESEFKKFIERLSNSIYYLDKAIVTQDGKIVASDVTSAEGILKYLRYIYSIGQLNEVNIGNLFSRSLVSGVIGVKIKQISRLENLTEEDFMILKKIADYLNNSGDYILLSLYLNKMLGIKHQHSSADLDLIHTTIKLNNLDLFDDGQVDVSNYWIHNLKSGDIKKMKSDKCKLDFGYSHGLPLEEIVSYFEEIEIRIYRTRFVPQVASMLSQLQKSKKKEVIAFLNRLEEIRKQFRSNTKMGTILQSKDGKLKIEIRSMR